MGRLGSRRSISSGQRPKTFRKSGEASCIAASYTDNRDRNPFRNCSDEVSGVSSIELDQTSGVPSGRIPTGKCYVSRNRSVGTGTFGIPPAAVVPARAKWWDSRGSTPQPKTSDRQPVGDPQNGWRQAVGLGPCTLIGERVADPRERPGVANPGVVAGFRRWTAQAAAPGREAHAGTLRAPTAPRCCRRSVLRSCPGCGMRHRRFPPYCSRSMTTAQRVGVPGSTVKLPADADRRSRPVRAGAAGVPVQQVEPIASRHSARPFGFTPLTVNVRDVRIGLRQATSAAGSAHPAGRAAGRSRRRSWGRGPGRAAAGCRGRRSWSGRGCCGPGRRG